MAPCVEEIVPFQQITAQHEWRDQIDDALQANYRCVIRCLCSGAILACIAITWNVFHVNEIREDTSGVFPTAFVAKALTCCAQGSGGMPGICLRGDPNGICCGSELALLCGAGSSCYTNAQGSPYCCGKHTSGCANVCLDNFTRGNYISRGGVCNPVSPQGFNADGTTLYVDAPWDGSRMSYLSDGTHNITFVNPPIQLGARDFTMTVTLIPRNDSVFGTQDIGTQFAVLMRRIEILPEDIPEDAFTGYQLTMSQVQAGSGNTFTNTVQIAISLFRNSRAGISSGSNQIAFFFLSVPILANVPISLRIIRQGFNLTVFENNVQLPPSRQTSFGLEGQPIDVDTNLNVPLTISPRNIFSAGGPVNFVGSLRDLSITSAAEFP